MHVLGSAVSGEVTFDTRADKLAMQSHDRYGVANGKAKYLHPAIKQKKADPETPMRKTEEALEEGFEQSFELRSSGFIPEGSR